MGSLSNSPMNIQELKEFRKDGTLKYECTKRLLSEKEAFLFDRRISGNSISFVYLSQTKYKTDGSIDWRLIYNEKGEVIGTEKGAKKNHKCHTST